MKKIILILSIAILAFPISAQPVRKYFTGMTDSMELIPDYVEGKTYYVNPRPGGQSGNLVIVREGKDQYRLWDNMAKKWASESLKGMKRCFFINPNTLFIGMNSGRCDFLPALRIDGIEFTEASLCFTEWRFFQRGGIIEYLGLALNGKWGVVAPNGEFIVPTRYESFEAARAALKERSKAVKPMGMTDMEFIVTEVRKLLEEGNDMYDLTIDWSWFDKEGQAFYYTLKELPWCGPYADYGVDEEPKPESVVGDAEPAEPDAKMTVSFPEVGVDNGVLAYVPSPRYFKGAMLPMTFEFIWFLREEPIPIPGSPGDYFFCHADLTQWDYYDIEGLRINKDGSFQHGYFSLRENDLGHKIPMDYICAPAISLYDFSGNYWLSEHNKGNNPSDEQILQAFKEQVCKFYCDADFYALYDEDKKALQLWFAPRNEEGCCVTIPTTKARAEAFVRDNRKYEWQDFVVNFDRKVRDDGSVYIDNLYITSPSGIHFDYKAK